MFVRDLDRTLCGLLVPGKNNGYAGNDVSIIYRVCQSHLLLHVLKTSAAFTSELQSHCRLVDLNFDELDIDMLGTNTFKNSNHQLRVLLGDDRS